MPMVSFQSSYLRIAAKVVVILVLVCFEVVTHCVFLIWLVLLNLTRLQLQGLKRLFKSFKTCTYGKYIKVTTMRCGRSQKIAFNAPL